DLSWSFQSYHGTYLSAQIIDGHMCTMKHNMRLETFTLVLHECSDANTNCAGWQTNNQFCIKTTNTDAMKLLYCCRTCRENVLAPTTTKPINDCPALKTISQAQIDARYPGMNIKCSPPSLSA
ncbi:hypothetical protein PENTCL1PPCAC_8493, partial [Pristionchus entomophagus]